MALTTNHRLIANISYPGGGGSPYQCFDLYLPLSHPEKPAKLIMYIHGGAWRTGDKADKYSSGLIANLSQQFPMSAIGSINYRLSNGGPDGESGVKHPAHNEDVARAIDHAHSLDELVWVEATYLIGHSVGAFISLSIAGLLVPASGAGPQVRRQMHGLVLVDGIYDLEALLEEYPGYKSFVLAAFTPAHVPHASPVLWPPANLPARLPSILLIHSRHDSLLSLRQSHIALAALRDKLPLADRLQADFDSVVGDHDTLLLSPELALRIKTFIHS